MLTGLALGPLLLNLLASVAVVALVMVCTLLLALRLHLQSIVDTVWGLGFVGIAATSFALSAGHGDHWVRLIVLTLTALWGLRLATYLHLRNHGKGEDPRYAALLRRNDGPVVPYVVRTIYWPQGSIMWVVSLPTQVAMYESHRINALVGVGIALWVVGLAFESVGDAQLARFKRRPESAGQVMDRGLWAWTRHPNYFGDACVWAGLGVLACSHWVGLLALVGPAVMTHMLLNRSGKALLERTMARRRGSAYAQYLARTSGFFPRPPLRHALLPDAAPR